jgi:translation initiation factor IF-3
MHSATAHTRDRPRTRFAANRRSAAAYAWSEAAEHCRRSVLNVALSLTCCGKAPIFCVCPGVTHPPGSACRRRVATAKETKPIRRPIRTAQPAPKEGPRINEEIRVREIQLIDKDGINKGVIDTPGALAMAQEAGLDLVEIAPNSSPPVCKILDYGKYKYQAQKKAAEARKKQKIVEIKEIKLRPMIDDHDYDVKMRSMQRFFEEGDKVKVTLRFRGREMAHQDLGYKLLDRVKGDTSKVAKIEQEPRFEGRQVVMVLAPR